MNYAIDTNKNISETFKLINKYTTIKQIPLANKSRSRLIIKMANLSETRFLLEIVKTMLDQKSGPSEGQYGGGRQILKNMIRGAFALTMYQGKAKKYVEKNLEKTGYQEDKMEYIYTRHSHICRRSRRIRYNKVC